MWIRFEEAPEAYPNLAGLLRQAKPKAEDSLFFKPERSPQYNEKAEAELNVVLERLASLAPDAAAAEIEELETVHGSAAPGYGRS